MARQNPCLALGGCFRELLTAPRKEQPLCWTRCSGSRAANWRPQRRAWGLRGRRGFRLRAGRDSVTWEGEWGRPVWDVSGPRWSW